MGSCGAAKNFKNTTTNHFKHRKEMLKRGAGRLWNSGKTGGMGRRVREGCSGGGAQHQGVQEVIS